LAAMVAWSRPPPRLGTRTLGSCRQCPERGAAVRRQARLSPECQKRPLAAEVPGWSPVQHCCHRCAHSRQPLGALAPRANLQLARLRPGIRACCNQQRHRDAGSHDTCWRRGPLEFVSNTAASLRRIQSHSNSPVESTERVVSPFSVGEGQQPHPPMLGTNPHGKLSRLQASPQGCKLLGRPPSWMTSSMDACGHHTQWRSNSLQALKSESHLAA